MTANPVSVVVGSTVAISIPFDYAGCRNTPLTVTDNNPAGVAYASCSTGSDWSCAGVSTTSGVTSSSFTPGNNGNRSGTLNLAYTATSAGTRTITLAGNISAASQSVSFAVTSPASQPTVVTDPASGLTSTGATLNGTVTSNGATTTVSFAYGTSIAYGTTVTANPSPLSDSANGAAVSYTLTGLACGSSYHYRAQGANAVGTTNGNDATFTTPSCLPSPTLEYLFNEAAWSGVAGEVQDSSGNGYHGTASGLAGTKPSTTATSPAVGGASGTCGYGVFNRANKDYVAVPPAFPNLGASSSFTVTAWIRTTNNALSGQRVFADDQSNSSGFAVSLGDGGAGVLRFFQRGGGSSVIMDTGPVIANNTWYFVAAVADIAAKTRRVYVYGAGGALLASPSITYSTPSFGTDAGPASIGGETNASGEGTRSFGFAGNIDELRIYPAVLSPGQIDLVRGLASVCGSSSLGPDHYELSIPATGISCLPTPVTVTACADGSNPCTNPYRDTSGHTATLSASAGSLGATTLSFNALGVATTTLSHPTAVNGATATVTLSGETPAASHARQCCQGGSCSTAGSCSTTFSTAGFVVAAAEGGSAATIPTQTAGNDSSRYALRAIQTNTMNKACEAAITGTASVNWSYTCNDPATCSSGNRLTVTGNSAVAVAGNPNGGGGNSTAVSMTFDADGNAPFSLRYADVGRITLAASRAAGGSLLSALSGSSNAFVARPAGFTLSDIRCSSYSAGACATAVLADPGYNPGAANAAGTAFVPAGQTFSATVIAVDALGNATPNYGRETAAEGVRLSANLVAPAGGNAPALSNPSAFGSFSGGAANGNTFAWSEAGIITLTPSVADANYLGTGNVTGTTSGNVGRFYAHHLTTTVAPACSGSFSYAGQPFAATVAARNAAGTLLQNYGGGSFAKAVTLSDGAALGVGSLSGAAVAAGAFTAGNAGATPSYAFTNKLTAPQTLTLRATDSDGVSSAGHAEDNTVLRSGRLRLANAFGRATAPLQLTAQADYWTGNAWILNGQDSCSSVPAAAVALSNQRNGQGAATAAWSTTPSAITIASGSGLLSLSAPNPAGTGSIDIGLNLGSTGTDQSCLASHPASTGAGLGWLRSRNGACAASYDRDPAARASFGIFSPETRKTVHVRELF